MRSEQIAQLLPDVFQSAFANRSAGGTEHDWPMTAPVSLVPYLAAWVDLDRMVRSSTASRGPIEVVPDRLRLHVSPASDLSRWRGTPKGLIQFLEAATGVRGFVVEENVTGDQRAPRDLHFRLVAPAQAAAQLALIDAILRSEAPAPVTYEVAFAAGEASTATPEAT